MKYSFANYKYMKWKERNDQANFGVFLGNGSTISSKAYLTYDNCYWTL